MKTRLLTLFGTFLTACTVCASAGELNVTGDMNVASNLTANAVTLGGETRTCWPSGGADTNWIAAGTYSNVVIQVGENGVITNVSVGPDPIFVIDWTGNPSNVTLQTQIEARAVTNANLSQFADDLHVSQTITNVFATNAPAGASWVDGRTLQIGTNAPPTPTLVEVLTAGNDAGYAYIGNVHSLGDDTTTYISFPHGVFFNSLGNAGINIEARGLYHQGEVMLDWGNRLLDGGWTLTDSPMTNPASLVTKAYVDARAPVPAGVVAVAFVTNIVVDASAGRMISILAEDDFTLGAATNAFDGQTIVYRIRNVNGAANSVTFGSGHRFGNLITNAVLSAVSNAVDYIGCAWNQADGMWDVLSVNGGFGE